MIELMRELKAAGLRMAMLTNNVREWEPVWRPMLPVDEIFETVVDSGFVGCRKPEARIYEMTLERLGLPAEACLFVDDLEPNIEGAREAGMQRGPLPRQRAGDRRDPAALLGDPPGLTPPHESAREAPMGCPRADSWDYGPVKLPA